MKNIISIITPSLNQSSFLSKAIETVFSQEGDFYIDYIIKDGKSSDSSIKIIRTYQDKLLQSSQEKETIAGLTFYKNNSKLNINCRGISYRWTSQQDKGQSDAINQGFSQAKGDILAWLNSDDYYYSNTLKYVLEAYNSYPNVGIYIGNANLVDKNGVLISRFSTGVGFDVKALIYGQTYLNQPSVFINKKAYDLVGGLDTELNFEMDTDYWIRIGKKFKAVVIDEALSATRIYDETKTSSGLFKRWNEMRKVRKKHSSKVITPGQLTELMLILQKPNIQEDLGYDISAEANKLYIKSYLKMQKVLGLKNNIPQKGISFQPTKLTISVVIPTTRAKYLPNALDSLYKNTKLPDEVIIVDQSEDKEIEQLCQTQEIQDLWKNRLVHIYDNGSGAARARNIGWNHATGEIIAFFDDDATVGEKWIETIQNEFANDKKQEIGILAGPITPIYPKNQDSTLDFPPKYKYVLPSYNQGINRELFDKQSSPPSVNYIIRKNMLTELKGFDEALGVNKNNKIQILGEDTDLTNRVRQKKKLIIYNPDVEVFHPVLPQRLKADFLRKRLVREGTTNAYLENRNLPHSIKTLFRDLLHKLYELFTNPKQDKYERFIDQGYALGLLNLLINKIIMKIKNDKS